MYAFIILVALALGLSVLRQALDELVPVPVPAAVSRLVTLLAGAGLAWTLDYSAFAAFGHELRAEWLHPLATGLVLVALGELVRSLVAAIAHRDSEPSTAPSPVRAPARAA